MAEHGPPAHRARHGARRAGRRGRTGHSRTGGGSSRRSARGSGGVLGLVLVAVVAVAGAGAAGGALLARASGSGEVTATPAAAPATTDGMPGARPTMLARVTDVISGDQVTADVAGRPVPVRILGISAPAVEAPGRPGECGGQAALAHARAMMDGQMVTLVPDPTLPELDDQGRRQAYVVLRTQLSYTDAALGDGVAREDTSRPLWYAPVFAKEQAEAARAGRGIWGAPCRVPAPA